MIINGIDGETHINVYSQGNTAIGKWLSNFAHAPITLDEGVFCTIEGYWYYLLTKDERFKLLNGFFSKKLGKELNKVKVIDDEFKNKIKKAIDIKLKTYVDKSKQLAETTLPLCHYYDYDGRKVDGKHNWIIEHIELRRKQLQKYYENKK